MIAALALFFSHSEKQKDGCKKFDAVHYYNAAKRKTRHLILLR
jgi:hypothetical protein